MLSDTFTKTLQGHSLQLIGSKIMKLTEGMTEYKMDWGMQVSNSVMTLTSTIRQECVGGGGEPVGQKVTQTMKLDPVHFVFCHAFR